MYIQPPRSYGCARHADARNPFLAIRQETDSRRTRQGSSLSEAVAGSQTRSREDAALPGDWGAGRFIDKLVFDSLRADRGGDCYCWGDNDKIENYPAATPPDSCTYFRNRSLFPGKLENCFSHTSENFASVFRLISLGLQRCRWTGISGPTSRT